MMQIKSRGPRLSKLDNREVSDRALDRLNRLKKYWKLREVGTSEELALSIVEVKRATLFNWQASYRAKGLKGLEPRSTRPRRVRQPCWSKQLEQQVLHLRKKYPFWGKKTLTTILKRDRGVRVSESTVGRILKRLTERGKIRPACFCHGRVKPKKRRQFSKHAKRWKKDLKRSQVGELVQVDHMSVEVGPGLTIKQFTGICPISKIAVAQGYSNASSKTAAKFLRQLIKELPFKVKSIQVDGGSEFMKDFEDCCEKLGIELYVLPPRSPELNGCVERSNRTLRTELYWLYDGCLDIKSVQSMLKQYLQLYNQFRPHQALQQLTPMAYYQSITSEAVLV